MGQPDQSRPLPLAAEAFAGDEVSEEIRRLLAEAIKAVPRFSETRRECSVVELDARIDLPAIASAGAVTDVSGFQQRHRTSALGAMQGNRKSGKAAADNRKLDGLFAIERCCPEVGCRS
jgi:hypothetical protein